MKQNLNEKTQDASIKHNPYEQIIRHEGAYPEILL